ncbi:MAG: Fe-S cluster assembly ATPase SufC [candidate division SR1 bacterium]|nr:Fe-S cluster assembly ATPase SufC [candidate division SR1 bacterium]
MLTIKNLSVTIANKEILKDISLNFELGKNYCILGQNGSGKSSLAMTIMGNPKYSIESGVLSIEKKNINDLTPNERAKLGIFLAFQHIPEIKGVKVFEFLRSIYDAKNGTTTSFLGFKKIIEPMIIELNIDKEFLRRDLNVGFSGGERRMLEILQLKLLEPKYIFLDEIDSGLDIDAIASTAKILGNINNKKNSLIFITHVFKIIEHIQIDEVVVLEKGLLKAKGDKKLIEKIKKEGFK